MTGATHGLQPPLQARHDNVCIIGDSNQWLGILPSRPQGVGLIVL